MILSALSLASRFWWALPMLGLFIAWQVTVNTLERRAEKLETCRADNRVLASAIQRLEADGKERREAIEAGQRMAQERVGELEAVRRRMEALSRQKGTCPVPDEVRESWSAL